MTTMNLQQLSPFWNPRWLTGLLLFSLFSISEAIVRKGRLPHSVQKCYNDYAEISFQNVVGQQFCYFCEEHKIEGHRAKSTPSRDTTSSVRYITDLLNKIDFQTSSTGRRSKRQAIRRCRRREYRTLSDFERNRFHRAVNALKRNTTVFPTKYDAIAAMHTGVAMNSAHGGPNFLGWHRVLVNIFERALQEEDPRICMPYWDSSLDNELNDPRQSSVFSPAFLGGRNSNGVVTDGPFARWETPRHGSLMRNIGVTGQLFRAQTIRNIMSRRRTSQIVSPNARLNTNIEFAHDGIHNFIGGQMMIVQSAAYDPVFFLHHAFVDYLWERFRDRQRSRGINPQFDYPMNAGSPLHAGNADLGFNLNRTAREGYWDEFAASYEYEPSPECDRVRTSCGSRYLRCNVRRQRCVPIDPRRFRIRRAVSNTASLGEHTPSFQPPCKSPIKPVQNSFCIDGVCDARQWVFVPVKVVTLRSPVMGAYSSFPILNGKLSKTYDIYQPSGYVATNQFSFPPGLTPKGYDKCTEDDGIGQVFVQSTGMNYDGFYKESALIDQRLPTSMSITYVAVKNPDTGPVHALFRAFDSCGRVCQPACKVPGTDRYKMCTGAMEIVDIPGQPRQYSYDIGSATVNTWQFQQNDDCPSLANGEIAVTFYCDYTTRIPWTSRRTSNGAQQVNRVRSSNVSQARSRDIFFLEINGQSAEWNMKNHGPIDGPTQGTSWAPEMETVLPDFIYSP